MTAPSNFPCSTPRTIEHKNSRPPNWPNLAYFGVALHMFWGIFKTPRDQRCFFRAAKRPSSPYVPAQHLKSSRRCRTVELVQLDGPGRHTGALGAGPARLRQLALQTIQWVSLPRPLLNADASCIYVSASALTKALRGRDWCDMSYIVRLYSSTPEYV